MSNARTRSPRRLVAALTTGLLIAALQAVSAGPAHAAGDNSISGTVTAEGPGAPGSILVQLYRQNGGGWEQAGSTTAGPGGAWSVTGLDDGSYAVAAYSTDTTTYPVYDAVFNAPSWANSSRYVWIPEAYGSGNPSFDPGAATPVGAGATLIEADAGHSAVTGIDIALDRNSEGTRGSMTLTGTPEPGQTLHAVLTGYEPSQRWGHDVYWIRYPADATLAQTMVGEVPFEYLQPNESGPLPFELSDSYVVRTEDVGWNVTAIDASTYAPRSFAVGGYLTLGQAGALTQAHLAYFNAATKLVAESTPVTQVEIPVQGGGSTPATLTVPQGASIQPGAQVVTPPSTDGGFTYPVGLLDFTVSTPSAGASIPIELVFPSSLLPDQVRARKYNRTTQTWGDIPGAVVTAVTYQGQPALKLTYTVTDGGALDEDGVVNGVIVDPVGLAKVPAFPSTVGLRSLGTPALPGATLEASPTGFPAGTTFAYQWLRDGKVIAGATSAKYTTGLADSGHAVSVKVAATHPGYVSTTLTSTKADVLGVTNVIPVVVKLIFGW